jgi:hypothetical protein
VYVCRCPLRAEPQRTEIQFRRSNISSHPRHRARSIQPPGGVFALGEYALFWSGDDRKSAGASKRNTMVVGDYGCHGVSPQGVGGGAGPLRGACVLLPLPIRVSPTATRPPFHSTARTRLPRWTFFLTFYKPVLDQPHTLVRMMCRGPRAPSSKWRLGLDPGRCSPASAGVAHAFAGRPARPDGMLGAASPRPSGLGMVPP